MKSAPEQLDFLLSQAAQFQGLLEVLPTAREVEDIPEALEKEIETEDDSKAWFHRRAARDATLDIATRLTDAHGQIDEMLSENITQIYDMFERYLHISSMSEEPQEEYEQSFLDIRFKQWESIFKFTDAKKLVSMVMTTWSPEQAERLGWLSPVRSRLKDDVALYVLSRVPYQHQTRLPEWWEYLAPVLAKSDKNSELGSQISRWAHLHATGEKRPSGGWTPATWVEKIKECGGQMDPSRLRLGSLIEPDSCSRAALSSVMAHHDMTRRRLDRYFSLDKPASSSSFSLFCPRTSPVLAGKSRVSGTVSTEKEALEKALGVVTKTLYEAEGAGRMDGHAMSEVFSDLDQLLAKLLNDQSLPSYATLAHELRSGLEVGSRLAPAPRSRKL